MLAIFNMDQLFDSLLHLYGHELVLTCHGDMGNQGKSG